MTTDITTLISDLRAKAGHALKDGKIILDGDGWYSAKVLNDPAPYESTYVYSADAQFIAAANPRVVMGLLKLLELYTHNRAACLCGMARKEQRTAFALHEAEILKEITG